MKTFVCMIVLPTLLTSGITLANVMDELTEFFQEQIDMFSNVSLTIFDDDENPVELALELPDFNLLNVFTDLNEVVTIQLFTNESGGEYEILGINNETALKESYFNANRRTYILTHGFMSSSDSPACNLVRYALQNTTDSNIITVNWSPLANGLYTVAKLFTPQIGEYIGKFINFLYEHGMNPETTTLYGHSLGAHIVGIAGQNVTKKVNHTIGCDPAWPLFVSVPENERLSPDDALHVEVIHTNAGLWGCPDKLGHYDFYPNGGSSQKGCKDDLISACSHGRSFQYLAEQILNPGPDFCSLKCASYSEFTAKTCEKEIAFMGGISSYPANPGTYYFETNDIEPFSLSSECA